MRELAAPFERFPMIKVGPVDMPVDVRSHAIERFRERVDRNLSREQATGELYKFIDGGHVRGRGPRWLIHRSATRGGRFLVNPEWPDTCLLIAASSRYAGTLAVVTVYTRDADRVASAVARSFEREKRRIVRRKTNKPYSRRSA